MTALEHLAAAIEDLDTRAVRHEEIPALWEQLLELSKSIGAWDPNGPSAPVNEALHAAYLRAANKESV